MYIAYKYLVIATYAWSTPRSYRGSDTQKYLVLLYCMCCCPGCHPGCQHEVIIVKPQNKIHRMTNIKDHSREQLQ